MKNNNNNNCCRSVQLLECPQTRTVFGRQKWWVQTFLYFCAESIWNIRLRCCTFNLMRTMLIFHSKKCAYSYCVLPQNTPFYSFHLIKTAKLLNHIRPTDRKKRLSAPNTPHVKFRSKEVKLVLPFLAKPIPHAEAAKASRKVNLRKKPKVALETELICLSADRSHRFYCCCSACQANAWSSLRGRLKNGWVAASASAESFCLRAPVIR